MKSTHDWDYRIVYSDLLEKDAFDFERLLIEWYRKNTNFRLTNVTDGGEGTSGWIPDENFKKKQSEISKARWNDPNYKAKIISDRHKPESTYQSEAFKSRISELVSGSKNPNYKHYWSEEQKQNLSEKRRSNGKSKGVLNNKAKAIRCVETGEEFPLITLAMEKYNVRNISSFSVALDNPKRTAAHLHWVTISPQ